MQQRRTLTLAVAARSDEARAAIIRRAIEERRCVAGLYNQGMVRLAPHILFARHGDLFVDGVVLDRNGSPPREVKLASFKLKGLSGLKLLDEQFAEPDDPALDRRTYDSVLARLAVSASLPGAAALQP